MKKRMLVLTCCLLLTAMVMGLSFAWAEAATQPDRKITFDSESYIIYVGKQQKITAAAERLTEDAPKKTTLNWVSSDPEIVTVNKGGTLAGKSAGTATITASAADDESVSGTVTVEVRIPVQKVTINEKDVTLLLGAGEDAAVGKLSCRVEPENAYFQTGKWSSSKEGIVKVDEDGTIHAVSSGNATVTFISDDPNAKKKAQVQIKVNQAAEDIDLSENTITMDKGSSVTVKATVKPADASVKKVTWKSSDEKVATVGKNGNIKGTGHGTCTITCTAADGSGIQKEVTVTVISMVKSIGANGSKKIVLFAGKTEKASVKIKPSDATNKKIKWSSSDSHVAKVSTDGIITGVSRGKCKITAEAADGSKKKFSFDVVVEPKNPITLEGVGFGIFQQNLLALTVKNHCQTKKITNFDFDVTLYSGWATESGSYNLGKNSSVAPGAKKTIKRNLFGVSYSSSISIQITGVHFSDGTYYAIPEDVQENWKYSR